MQHVLWDQDEVIGHDSGLCKVCATYAQVYLMLVTMSLVRD